MATLAGYEIRRPTYAYRKAGNRDLYLRRADGVGINVWPLRQPLPNLVGPYVADIPGVSLGGFPTREIERLQEIIATERRQASQREQSKLHTIAYRVWIAAGRPVFHNPTE